MLCNALTARPSAVSAVGRAVAQRSPCNSCGRLASAPAKARCDVFKDSLDDMGVVVDTKLIRDGQEQRVSFGDGFVFRELLNENVRLGGVAAAKNGACVVAEEADAVLVLVLAPEIGTVAVVHQRKDAA